MFWAEEVMDRMEIGIRGINISARVCRLFVERVNERRIRSPIPLHTV